MRGCVSVLLAVIGLYVVIAMLRVPRLPQSNAIDDADMARAQADASKDEIQAALAEATVRSSLRDPDSAKIDYAGHGCGTVNARNGFGGYSGAQRFVIAGSQVVLENTVSTQVMDNYWRNNGCA